MERPKYVDAVVEVIQRTLSMMFDIDAHTWAMKKEESQSSPFEISGVIGITGPVTGSVVISFPQKLALEMTARTFDSQNDAFVTEGDIFDCVGEVANVVGGNLLPLFGKDGRDLRLSVPSVVVGTHRVVWRLKETPYELILFETEWGHFGVGFHLHEKKAEETKSEAAHKFMIIDDSRVARRLLVNALKETDIGEFQAKEFGNALTALKALEECNYDVDLIFCDVNMPEMEGPAFLEEMVKRGKLASCPVIMVTGDVSRERSTECMAKGAKDLIEKPFMPETVQQALNKILSLV